MSILESATREVTRLRSGLLAVSSSWGATPDEEAASYPCDRLLPDAEQWMFRAVDVAAPASTTFRWLCQLKVAPYSYDWIDNWGKRSPRTLTPGLEDVQAGQRAVAIFRIIDVEPGRSITLHTPHSVFGKVVMTYCAVPVDEHRSRIVAKLGIIYPKGVQGTVMRAVLPLGDLVMMRKQLQTLAELAATTAREGARSSGPRL